MPILESLLNFGANFIGRPPVSSTDPRTSAQGNDTRSIVKSPPFFAFIIGINEYISPKIHNLKGAVSDALAIKKYLEQNLRVPASQISILCDEQATRAAIIQGFNGLLTDQRIRVGDPILIFYAGHGSEVDAPKDWEAGDAKIQMIIPHDCLPDGRYTATHGIPDRTIGALLSRIAEKCGDNITVIFDCCHSGSGTRDISEPSRLARSVELEIPKDTLPSNLDQEIWTLGDAQHKKGGVGIAPGFLHYGLRSHILLAACGAKERAYEDNGYGVFTKALLDMLFTTDAQNITYANLLQRLPSLTQQNPQCEGQHQNRALFNAKVQTRGRAPFQLREEGDHYVLNAGSARGIVVGDEFTVYQNSDLSQSSLLGVLVVREPVRPFQCTLEPLLGAQKFQLHDKPAFALQTKVGKEHDLSVHIAELGLTPEQLDTLLTVQSVDLPSIRRVEKKDATLSITLGAPKQVVFDIQIADERLEWQRIPSSVDLDVDAVRSVIDATANFCRHLSRTDKYHNLQKKVRLELTGVVQVQEGHVNTDDGILVPVIEPIGSNLNQNGVIDLVSGSQEYGIKVLNDSSVSLYAALFYFDTNNLSITLLNPLAPTSQYKVDPPLLPKGSITLGYGAGGGAPLVFTLGSNRDLEVGFIKLFLSTEYVDLSDIEQLSPFVEARGMSRAEISPMPSTWDTLSVKVVVRKEKASTLTVT